MELEKKSDPAFQSSPARRENGIVGYLINIAISIVLLYILNNLLNLYVPWIPGDFSKFFWNILNNVYNHVEIPHLSKAFVQCLWAINIFLGFSIIGNFVLILYRPRWFHHLVQSALAGLAIMAFSIVYAIYPFNFDNSAINTGIRVVLIIIMVGLGIGLLSEFVRFIFAVGRDLRGRQKKALPVVTPIEDQPSDQIGDDNKL